MTFEPEIAVVLCLLVLIGGPAYLIGKAVERRRARKAEAWLLSPAGFQHHAMVTSSHVDSLGPLSFAEHEALLFNAFQRRDSSTLDDERAAGRHPFCSGPCAGDLPVSPSPSDTASTSLPHHPSAVFPRLDWPARRQGSLGTARRLVHEPCRWPNWRGPRSAAPPQRCFVRSRCHNSRPASDQTCKGFA